MQPTYFNGYLGAASNSTASADNAATSIPADTTALVQQFLPVLTDTLPGLDPHQRVGVYEAKIRNYEVMKKKLPFAATFYDNEIRKLKAKLAAARKEAALKDEGVAATRQWRGLGQGTLLVGAGVGLALIYYFVKKARA